jgi:hypothetical protein
MGAAVAGAKVGEAGGAIADEDAGDLADDPGDRGRIVGLPRWRVSVIVVFVAGRDERMPGDQCQLIHVTVW